MTVTSWCWPRTSRRGPTIPVAAARRNGAGLPGRLGTTLFRRRARHCHHPRSCDPPCSWSTITTASGPGPAPCSRPTGSTWSARRRAVARPSRRPTGSGPTSPLIDIGLPDLDGFAVAAAIRAAGTARRIVLISGREAADFGGRVAGLRRRRVHRQGGPVGRRPARPAAPMTPGALRPRLLLLAPRRAPSRSASSRGANDPPFRRRPGRLPRSTPRPGSCCPRRPARVGPPPGVADGAAARRRGLPLVRRQPVRARPGRLDRPVPGVRAPRLLRRDPGVRRARRPGRPAAAPERASWSSWRSGAAMLARTAWRLVGTQPGDRPGQRAGRRPRTRCCWSRDVDRSSTSTSRSARSSGVALWLVAAAAIRRLLLDRRPGATADDRPGADRRRRCGRPSRAPTPWPASWSSRRASGSCPDGGTGRLLEWLPAGARAARAAARDEPAALGLGRGRGDARRRATRRRGARSSSGRCGGRSATRRSASCTPPATAAGSTTRAIAAALPAPGDGRAATTIEADGRATRRRRPRREPARRPGRSSGRSAPWSASRVDNARLQDDLRAQLEEVRASRTRIVEAADAERRRVERDLHDGAQQRLVALARVAPDDPLAARAGRPGRASPTELDAAAEEVRAAIAELRELAQGLDPAILREAGLGAAVQSLADRSPVPGRGRPRRSTAGCPSGVETAAYFVAAEALANVAKHAHAERGPASGRRATTTACGSRSPTTASAAPTSTAPGLRGLVDRVAAVGGTFAISAPPGGGTADRGDDPVRVVIGEDSRAAAGGPRAAPRRRRVRGRRASPATSTPGRARRGRPARTSPSSTSGCRRRFTDEGLRAARHIRAMPPPTPGCLVLSQHVDAAVRRSSSSSQASGGIGLPAQGARRGRRRLPGRRAAGGPGRVASSTRRSCARWSPAGAATCSVDLTDREREVLELMAQGRSNAAICRALGDRREDRRGADQHDLLEARAWSPPTDDNRRVLAVLALLRGAPTA